jgi:hypothetical protein
MLLFLDRFLASKGLEGEFSLVYGAALGAVRNGTILPSTNDVDIALSPRGLIFLEQNATRAELYRLVVWGRRFRHAWPRVAAGWAEASAVRQPLHLVSESNGS